MRTRTSVEIHSAIEQRNGKAPAFKELRQHGLRRYELGEDQHLEFWIVLFLLKFVDQFEERFGLGVRSLSFSGPGQFEQRVDLFREAREARSLVRVPTR